MQREESVIGAVGKPTIIASILRALKYICYLETGVGLAKFLRPAIKASPIGSPSASGLKSADPAIVAPSPFEAIKVRRVNKVVGGRTLTKLDTLVGHVEGARRQRCLFIPVKMLTITASAKLMAGRCSSASTPISSMASDKVRMSLG
jgi:hypothetical protein